MLYLTIFIVLLTILILLLRRRFTFWSRQGVKGKNGINFFWFIHQHHKLVMQLNEKYGKLYGGYRITNKFLAVNEPELIREIFVKNFQAFPNHMTFNIGPDPKVNKMLFFMSGDENWKRVRSIISPAFTSGKLKAMMSHISDISDNLIANLEKYEQKSETVDMRQYIGAFVMDVISACAYGIKVDSINNPEHPVVVNAKKVFGLNANFSQIISLIAPPIASYFRLNFFDPSATKYFDDLTNQIVMDRKKLTHNSKNQEKGKKRTDFIQLMMDSEQINTDLDIDCNKDEPESSQSKTMGTLAPDELIAQGIMFFVAGYDTTSASLSHLVYYLAQNNNCQQRLYEELKCVDEFTYDKLGQLKYLNAVIDETLRLAPPLLRIQRQCEQEITLNGIRITKDCTIDVLPYVLHRDPDYWPEPNEFKPERFLNPVHHPWAYLPFGGGPRLCIGQRFALNEMRICTAKLLKKFEFSIAPGFEQLEYFAGNALLSPKNVMVNLKARN